MRPHSEPDRQSEAVKTASLRPLQIHRAVSAWGEFWPDNPFRLTASATRQRSAMALIFQVAPVLPALLKSWPITTSEEAVTDGAPWQR